ncbi:MAG: PfkB family carbohydrate kinase [Emcibacteraceae bacterium]|nr:PfkB family carbohydrate kinase [Emcibacteraceae bacterium]
MQKTPTHIDQKHAIVIGGSNMDICASSTDPLHMHDSNPGHIITSPGGVGRNIAENLARLGVETRLISAVGNDIYGNQILDKGTQSGINMDNVSVVEKMPTSTYLSILDDQNDMLVAVSDMGILEMINLVPHLELIKKSPLVIADTNLTEATIDELIKAMSNQPLIIDTVSTSKAIKIIPYLRKIHTIKANLAEAKVIANDEKDLNKIAAYLHQKGVTRVFITLGPEGVFYSDGETSGTLKKEANDIVNTNGAGDAFTASLGYSWLQGWDLIKTAQFAICASEVALAHEETINPEMLLDIVQKIKELEYGV